ncbi:MAG: carboxymuconolactone decarboxylase family protein [Limnochordaceae bacterium]|nr:carboxymuconolactone decarboxylase family protein [Limnochordaceae bacterium]
MKGFMELHEAAIQPGALSTAVKELIALGIAIAVHCEGCIACHVHDALKAGATPEQIEETIGVAVLMAGGPGVVYGSLAHTALQQFLAENK